MSNATEAPSAVSASNRRAGLVDFFVKLLQEKPLGTFCGIIVLLFILVAVFAEVLAPFPHDEVNILDRMQQPSEQYLLGTDKLGRDLLSRLIVGAHFVNRRSGRDGAQCDRRGPDRQSLRIPGRESGPGGAKIC